MTDARRVPTRSRATNPGSLALSALGLVVGLVGTAWWAFDADPLRGKFLLVLGAITAVIGDATRGRLRPTGQRWLLVLVGLLALLTLVDVLHLVQVVNDQRAAHSA